ncbi:hypothetical protein ACOJTA_11430 [Malaciobacter sp. WC5094]
MFKEVDVIFFVEHKDRELDSIEYLAKMLYNNYGVSCIILPIHFYLFYLIYYKPKLVVSYFISSKEHFPIPIVKSIYPKAKYLSMNWEQLLFPINLEFKRPKDEFAQREIYHISWDENFYNYLLSMNVKPDNIRITGNIALFLMEKSIEEKKKIIYNKLNSRYSFSSYEKIIFFPMNLAWAFFNKEDLDSRLKNGYDPKILYAHHELAKKYLSVLLKWISKASKEYERYLFVIRPHPYIVEDDYINAFGEMSLSINSNIVISKEATVKEWLSISDKNYSNWSSVIYDANVMGRHGSLLVPFSRPKWLEVPWNSDVPNIINYESFIRDLTTQNSHSKIYNNKNIDKNVAKYIYDIFKEHEKIAIVTKYSSFLDHLKLFITQYKKIISCILFNCKKVHKGQIKDFFTPKRFL